MPSFWTLLQAKMRAGEMEYEEALRRDNYHSFVKEMPNGPNPVKYVMETPADELPPCVSSFADEIGTAYRHYIECVRDGSMTPYEAAQAYFDMVSG